LAWASEEFLLAATAQNLRKLVKLTARSKPASSTSTEEDRGILGREGAQAGVRGGAGWRANAEPVSPPAFGLFRVLGRLWQGRPQRRVREGSSRQAVESVLGQPISATPMPDGTLLCEYQHEAGKLAPITRSSPHMATAGARGISL
jgi:hypothetical protein